MSRTAWIGRSIALWLAWLPAIALPQVVRDGTIGPGASLQPVGPAYLIPQSMGALAGSNLFHSFGKFGLATGETATFTPNGATSPVGNVIGRVTGGAPSSIDGKIQSNIAGANVYLINPNGIVFGPNAAINVSGAFRASTADYVRMSDGGRFQATNPDASTLTAASAAMGRRCVNLLNEIICVMKSNVRSRQREASIRSRG